jgi:hypothetical protein
LLSLEISLIRGPVSAAFSGRHPVVARTIRIHGDQTLANLHRAIFDALDRKTRPFLILLQRNQARTGDVAPGEHSGPRWGPFSRCNSVRGWLPGEFDDDLAERVHGRHSRHSALHVNELLPDCLLSAYRSAKKTGPGA